MVAGIPFSNDFDLHINRLRKVLHEFLRSEETFQKLDSTVVVLDVILPINSPLLQGSDEFDLKNRVFVVDVSFEAAAVRSSFSHIDLIWHSVIRIPLLIKRQVLDRFGILAGSDIDSTQPFQFFLSVH